MGLEVAGGGGVGVSHSSITWKHSSFSTQYKPIGTEKQGKKFSYSVFYYKVTHLCKSRADQAEQRPVTMTGYLTTRIEFFSARSLVLYFKSDKDRAGFGFMHNKNDKKITPLQLSKLINESGSQKIILQTDTTAVLFGSWHRRKDRRNSKSEMQLQPQS